MHAIGGLGLRDIGTLTEISGALASLHDAATLRATVPGLVAQLVPGVRAVWNEIDLVHGRNDIVSSTPLVLWPESAEDLIRNLGQHPIFRHYRHTGDGQPHAISELVSPAEFRRTDLYGEVYRRIGLEDQLATTVFHGDRLVELTVDRDRWGFSERDRLALSVLRPMLVTKYAALEEPCTPRPAARGARGGRRAGDRGRTRGRGPRPDRRRLSCGSRDRATLVPPEKRGAATTGRRLVCE